MELDGVSFDVKNPGKQNILYMRRNTAMVFQQFNLFKEKNARENVMMGLTHVQNKSKEEAEKIQVTDLEVSDITQFSYVLDGTTLSFTKNGTEWTYDGDQSVDIDESALETLLNKASAITASDEVTEYDDLADFGLDDPANTVTLKTDSGLTTIYIGSQNEITNEYYLKTGDSDTIYVVDSAPATGFDKSIEDLTAKADDTETEAEEPSEAVDETETATVVPNETETVETEETETK